MQTLQKLYQLTDQRLSKQKLKGKLKICSWVFLALIKCSSRFHWFTQLVHCLLLKNDGFKWVLLKGIRIRSKGLM